MFNQLADYVPCNTPITVSITIGQIQLPMHPLDMSLHPSNDPTSTSCVGTIQANPSVDQGKVQGDIILGVPFLRNVYVVHDLGSKDGIARKPRLGVASLTNATLAAAEFQNVRIKNLSPDGSPNGMNGNSREQPTRDGMNTALKIGVGILIFVVVCGALCGVLRWTMRRRLRQEQRHAKTFERARLGGSGNSYRVLLLADEGTSNRVRTQDKRGFFERLFARKGYHQAGKGESTEPTEDELRMRRFEEYKRRRAQEERDSIWSQGTGARDTLVGDDPGFGHKPKWSMDEFGMPLDPPDDQRGRQMKDETCSSGSTRSRTLSPGPVAADSAPIGHWPSSRASPNAPGPLASEPYVSQATFTTFEQPTRTSGHARTPLVRTPLARTPLAVEPNLSPLTEATDSLLTTVSTALQHSTPSHPEMHKLASPEEPVGIEGAPDSDFNPLPTPVGSAARSTDKSEMPLTTSITQLRPALPSGSLRGPRPPLPSRNPYRKAVRPTAASPEVRTPSTRFDESVISGDSVPVPLPGPIATPSSHGPGAAVPPGLSPYMGAPTDPSQWTSIVPAPRTRGAPTVSPLAPLTPPNSTYRSVQPVAHLLAHGTLPPGAAPPMTRQQSNELFTPANLSSPGFNMPLLSSRAFTTPPNTPPANVVLNRTTSATSFPPVAPLPDSWVPPQAVTGTPTIDTAAPPADLLPTPSPLPLSSREFIEQLTVAQGDGNSGNTATPTTSGPPSSTHPEDGHSGDPPVQSW